MRPWLRVAGIIVGGIVVIIGAAMAIAAEIWNRATARTIVRLQTQVPAAESRAVIRFSRDDLANLPAPVARYFTFALTDGQPLVRQARLTQSGTFAMRRNAWSPFTATEYFTAGPPGFVWDARIRMAPLLTARVRDSYVGGEGAIFGKVNALVTVVEQRGTPEMASGALLRYLAEAVWLPSALLPRCGVRWSAVDDSTARASITDHTTTVSMEVHFGARGEITRIAAERYRDDNGKAVLTPWIGTYHDYGRSSGMMVPMRSEVGWMLPDGWFPYWRGQMVAAVFE
jgi:uncharacterized protein DUF6544